MFTLCRSCIFKSNCVWMIGKRMFAECSLLAERQPSSMEEGKVWPHGYPLLIGVLWSGATRKGGGCKLHEEGKLRQVSRFYCWGEVSSPRALGLDQNHIYQCLTHIVTYTHAYIHTHAYTQAPEAGHANREVDPSMSH